jgi:hypothetical protein
VFRAHGARVKNDAWIPVPGKASSLIVVILTTREMRAKKGRSRLGVRKMQRDFYRWKGDNLTFWK